MNHVYYIWALLVKVHRAQIWDGSILRAESIEQRKVRLISRDTSPGTWFESWWVIDFTVEKIARHARYAHLYRNTILRDISISRQTSETRTASLRRQSQRSSVRMPLPETILLASIKISALTSRSSNHKVRNESELWLSPKHLSAALISSNAKWSRTSSSNSDARNERDPITFFSSNCCRNVHFEKLTNLAVG